MMLWGLSNNNLLSGNYTITSNNNLLSGNYTITNNYDLQCTIIYNNSVIGYAGSYISAIKMAERHYKCNQFPKNFTFKDNKLYFKNNFVLTFKNKALAVAYSKKWLYNYELAGFTISKVENTYCVVYNNKVIFTTSSYITAQIKLNIYNLSSKE